MDRCGRLFEKLLLAVNDAQTFLDLGFGWEPFSALTGALGKKGSSGCALEFAIQPPGRVSRQVALALVCRSSGVGQDTGIPVCMRQG
jgi:hypothetical protein